MTYDAQAKWIGLYIMELYLLINKNIETYSSTQIGDMLAAMSVELLTGVVVALAGGFISIVVIYVKWLETGIKDNRNEICNIKKEIMDSKVTTENHSVKIEHLAMEVTRLHDDLTNRVDKCHNMEFEFKERLLMLELNNNQKSAIR